MKAISKTEATRLIKETRGKIFTVHFVKKNGELRKMNCRTGVSKYVTGKGLSFDPSERGLLPVYDVQAKGYRMINLSALRGLTMSKIDYVVKD